MAVLLDAIVHLLAPLCRRFRVRVHVANINRIGDMNLELGGFVKRRRVGWEPRQRAIVIPSPFNTRAANAVALVHLRRQVRVLPRNWLYPLLFRLHEVEGIGGRLNGYSSLPDRRQVRHYVASAGAQVEWEAQRLGPLLMLEPELARHGNNFLRDLGLPPDAWFVALHAREGGFLHEDVSSHHQRKNVDVLTYLPAIRAIVEEGGWVIRVGDSSMKPLPDFDQVVDYAHHAAKSPALDVFLAASCQFWLGTNSGYYFVAHNFGRPVGITNLLPISFRPWGSVDRFIPKLYEDPETGRVLSFPEMLAPELFRAREVAASGIRPVDNTPAELEEFTREMIEVAVRQNPTYSAEDEALQTRYNSLVDYYPCGVLSRIGRGFLDRHRDLFEITSAPSAR